MDTSDPDIVFDDNGVCNHCKRYDDSVKMYVLTGDSAQRRLNDIVNKIRTDGRDAEYDCIIGVSGGADSTYNAYIAKKAGLRPLAVHLDNGWDAELAVSNIERTLNSLDIELYTHVIDWEEFRDLQLAYLRSGCVNIEVLTDHAIWALLYHTAAEHNVKYILSGTNVVTEGIMPGSWGYDHMDLPNMLDIYKKCGSGRNLETYPMLTFREFAMYHFIKRIEYLSLLNYVTYRKESIKPFLTEQLGWKDYSGKHGESMFTYFYQSYILPRRLKVDKRRAHLACLICSGEITREEALGELEKPLYSSRQEEQEAIEYVAKKLGLTVEQFEALLDLPVKSNYDYRIDRSYNNPLTAPIRNKKRTASFVVASSILKLLRIR